MGEASGAEPLERATDPRAELHLEARRGVVHPLEPFEHAEGSIQVQTMRYWGQSWLDVMVART